MPKINVYLPDALASAVRAAGLPVSAICQRALADAVERVGHTRRGIVALRNPRTPADTLSRIEAGTRTRMTPRLTAVLAAAARGDEGQGRREISSLDLLRGLLDDSENLAVRLLIAQDVDLEALAGATTTSAASEPGPPPVASGNALLGRLTMPARRAFAAALDAVIALEHNYVGCEHLLVGLAASKSRAHDVLAGQGVRPAALRQAIAAATAGVMSERSRSAAQSIDALADLTRRIEAVESRLTTACGA